MNISNALLEAKILQNLEGIHASSRAVFHQIRIFMIRIHTTHI